MPELQADGFRFNFLLTIGYRLVFTAGGEEYVVDLPFDGEVTFLAANGSIKKLPLSELNKRLKA